MHVSLLYVPWHGACFILLCMNYFSTTSKSIAVQIKFYQYQDVALEAPSPVRVCVTHALLKNAHAEPLGHVVR